MTNSDTTVVKPKKEKPLPKLNQPTVKLIEPIRERVVSWCHDHSTSFSIQGNVLWIDFLAKEGLIEAAEVESLKKEATTLRKGGGNGYKAKAEAMEAEIAQLKTKLATYEK